jgi:chromate reductase
MRLPVCARAIMRANMTTYAVGYLVGSLVTKSINRLLAKPLVRVAVGLEMTEVAIKDLPLYS